MTDLGLIGFERSGKTSFFNAVTGARHPVGYDTHEEPHMGVVKVPDERLERLTALYHPRKHTLATLQYVDFPGAGFAGGGVGPSPRFLEQLMRMDALIAVVRAFHNEAVPPASGGVDPARDFASLALELAFADLALIDRRLERIQAESKALKASEREAAERESGLLRRVHAALEAGRPLRAQPLAPEERKALRNYRLLTALPLLAVLNLDESAAPEAETLAATFQPAVDAATGLPGSGTAAVSAALEMELAALPAEEAEEYRRALGAGEDALHAAIRLSYTSLGLISFFTVGPDECRAWTVREGDTALTAAGKIHTDLERGFIRAEVVRWQDLVQCGSEAEAKRRALLHTVGRDYIVQDGDVLHILFNV